MTVVLSMSVKYNRKGKTMYRRKIHEEETRTSVWMEEIYWCPIEFKIIKAGTTFRKLLPKLYTKKMHI